MVKWSFLAASALCAACLQAPGGAGAPADASTSDTGNTDDGAAPEGQWNFETAPAPFSKGGSTAMATDGNTA